MKHTITLEQAGKSFGDQRIFENLSLTMESGRGYGFAGCNGCGKTVLLKTVCGFSRLTTGRIVVDGKVIGRDRDFVTDAGVLLETPEFLNHLSGFRNLKLIAQIRNVISDGEILDAMKQFGIYGERDKPVRKYSLGMKQKLRLCQAVMERPEILILDEPTNALDKKSVAFLREYLAGFTAGGGLLLMTSHNREDLELCCHEIYEMEDGGLCLPEKP